MKTTSIVLKGIINTGVDEHQLDEYCVAMAELQSAVNFFKQTSDETPELKRVMTLYNTGREKMIEYYKVFVLDKRFPEFNPFVSTVPTDQSQRPAPTRHPGPAAKK